MVARAYTRVTIKRGKVRKIATHPGRSGLVASFVEHVSLSCFLKDTCTQYFGVILNDGFRTEAAEWIHAEAATFGTERGELI